MYMSDSDPTTYEMTAERISPKRTRIDTGDAEFVVGKDVNPVEFFVGSTLACLNSTGTMVAREMELSIDELSMSVVGDLDYSLYRGEESDNRAGLQGLTVEIDVDTDADQATVDEWLAAVKRRCPVTDNVEHETPLDVTAESV